MAIENVYYRSSTNGSLGSIGLVYAHDIIHMGNDCICVISEFTKHYSKLIGGKYFLHCEDGPAWNYFNHLIFFVNGVNVKIDDMPISEEDKLVLTLKTNGYIGISSASSLHSYGA